MRRTAIVLTLALLVSALSCASVWAQGGTAQISGGVGDTSGAVLPGVEITATQTDTGVARSTVTNETGNYVLPNLALGPYRLEAALPGFRTFVQTGVVLQINGSPLINIVLEVGQVSETVEVQANAVLVETRATGIGEVIDNTRILELPLIGRQVTDLVALAGASVQTGTLTATARSFPGVATFSIAGGTDRGTSYTLDGTGHNEVRGNYGLPLPFPDALQEFKVETSAVPAQYGFHSGGAINAVTKSGTNEFHGNAFWFVRNEVFNAQNFFASAGDGLKRNQFGGTLGGPIQTNKMFFFFGYQGTITRQAPSGASTSFVPTPAMLAGDFTTFMSSACQPTARTLPAPFVGNRIDPGQFSQAALNVAKLLPAAEDACGTVRWGLPISTNDSQYVAKLDYQLSGNHSVFGRYMALPIYGEVPNKVVNNPLTTGTAGQDNLFQALVFGDTKTFGSNLVNSLRLAWNRQATARLAPEFFGAKEVGVNVYQEVPKKIDIAVTNGFSVGSRTSMSNTFRETGFQVSDDVGLLYGNHQFNFGGSWMAFQTNNRSKTFTGGSFDFTGHFSGNALADFMLGRLSRLEQGNASRMPVRTKVAGLYTQDSWKVQQNLTLSLGLRWEPYIAQKFQYGSEYPHNHFDIEAFLRGEKTTQYVNAPAGLFYPGDPQFPEGGNPSNQINNRWAQFAPRVGLVWDPMEDGKTVIRTAYGLFYETQNAEIVIAVGQGPPWGGKAFLEDISFDDPYRNYSGGNPFPFITTRNAPYPSAGVFMTQYPDTRPPYVHQWNVGIQRQIGTDWLASASYIGNHMEHIYGAVELNPGVFISGVANASGICTTTVRGQTVTLRANAGTACSTAGNVQARRVLSLLDPTDARGSSKYSFIDAWDDRGTRDYHGMLLSLNKRMSDNFSITGNYTWSHCISHPTNTIIHGTAGGGVLTDPDDINKDRGNCTSNGQDVRHVVNSTTVLRMPRFSNLWAQRLAGNWNLSGILRAQSGGALNPVVSGDRSLTGQNSGTQRANVVSSDIYGNKCTSDLRASNPTCRWFNAAAFAVPALGTSGDAASGLLFGPGRWTIDAGLSRTFPIGENQRLEFRGEASNVLNHTTFNNPNANVSGATFGRITSARDPRIMQFAIKYIF